jgi:hypothetical protein
VAGRGDGKEGRRESGCLKLVGFYDFKLREI